MSKNESQDIAQHTMTSMNTIDTPQSPPSDKDSGTIQGVPLPEALGERYLSYALSTIVSRSLPDVRDGLKPVHRRILYAMAESGNISSKAYRKSASAVGYVMMKYHPHGDMSIYDALVRMAQDFSMRYPLVDGQGNFGSIDGDNAAAMRYTEARLTTAAEALMEGLQEDAVDFQPTYNGDNKEPKVLPASFPNLLANGSTGIAVGMATNIPPHHLSEISAALAHLIQNPEATVKDLMTFIKGPDFPTGSIIVESPETILETYETGRGSLRMRARWHVEELKGGQYQIVVTEIPFQVQKSRLIEKMAEALHQKKLPLLDNIRDESSTDIRLVLEPRSRTTDPNLLMASLFQHTALESKFNMNLNVVDPLGTPRVMNLKEVLKAFLDHRHEVLCRRSRHRLKQVLHRLEVLEGFLIVFLNLDEIIRIIREEDHPKPSLMARFKLSEIQAEAILNMRLKGLRKLEEAGIRTEHENLTQEKATLEDLLADSKKQWKHILRDVKKLDKDFGTDSIYGPRRTSFEESPILENLPAEAMIEKEPLTIACSQKGWIRALKGHLKDKDIQDLKYKEEDGERFILHSQSTDKLLVFASNGRFYTVGVDQLPGGRGQGDPIRHLLGLEASDEIISLHLHRGTEDKDQKLVVCASDGRGFMVPQSQVLAQTRNGKQILNVTERVKAVLCKPVEGDSVAIIGTNRKLLIFKVSELPEMNRGRGVKLQHYRDGHISDLTTFVYQEGLSWQWGERIRTETDLQAWHGRRGQSGRLPPVGFPRNNKFK